MVDNMTLKQLMGCIIGKSIPKEFENQSIDYEAALRDELKKLCGDYYSYQQNKWQLFQLITETVDEVLPNIVKAAIGAFADVIAVPDGTRCSFVVRLGRTRAKQFITRATEAGSYETFRLDRGQFDLYPHTYAGAARIDFERYLEGIEDMAELYSIIIDALTERVYDEIQSALVASWTATGRPAANKVYVNAFDAAKLHNLCNVIASYGEPVIYCTPQFAATLVNAIVYNSATKISDADVMDLRNRGYVGKFHGFPVVVLPQTVEEDDNSKLVFNPRLAYVIPSGKEKIVKVAFEGNTIVTEYDHEGDMSRTVAVYKKLAAGIVNTPNYWGMYYNAGIDAGGHTALNA